MRESEFRGLLESRQGGGGRAEGRNGGTAVRRERLNCWNGGIPEVDGGTAERRNGGTGGEREEIPSRRGASLEDDALREVRGLAIGSPIGAGGLLETHGSGGLRRNGSGSRSNCGCAALSAPTNIAEGSAKRGNREFRRFLDIALGSLSEVSYLLRFSRDRGLLTPAAWLESPTLCEIARANSPVWFYRSLSRAAQRSHRILAWTRFRRSPVPPFRRLFSFASPRRPT